MISKLIHKYYKSLTISLLICALMSTSSVVAQQFTMKGGISRGSVSVPPRDAADKSGKMINYYWEANFAYRFLTNRFVSVGIAYLGAGCTFHYTYQPSGFVIPYNVSARFSNLLFPIKFKVSSEHRAHPRFYGYVGTAPGWMFDEARELVFDGDPKNSQGFDPNRNNIPSWTPQKFQNYLLGGGGVYYKHVVLDITFYVSTFKDYKEFLAPVSFNYGIIFCIGYQVSRDTKKRW